MYPTFILLAQLASSGAPVLWARRTATPPSIDGRVEDAVWRQAEASDGFTQKTPSEGAPASEHTAVRVLFDDDAVYVAFECEQRSSAIVGRLTRRDGDAELASDSVTVDLGTRADGRTAFSFSVNVRGTLGDGVRFNDNQLSREWDENWQGAAALTQKGWSAEFRIPFRILRFGEGSKQSWDFQARRSISVRQEIDEWSYIPRHEGGEVSRYGTLQGVVPPSQASSIELRQFVLGQVRRFDPSGGGAASEVDGRLSAGVDFKYHVSHELTLDATFNPDFAQIEADQQILNLGNVETFLPEKRPFFLEGLDVFTTPRQLVYTRRIGSTPSTPDVLGAPEYGERLAELPNPATIYAASKLTGKVGDSWTIGALQALVAQNDLRLTLADGSRVQRIADPLTLFNVLRVRRELDSGHIGATLTSTQRLETGSDRAEAQAELGRARQSLCGSGALVSPSDRCFNDAYVSGLDWRWRSPGGDWVTFGQLTASMLSDGPPRRTGDGNVIQNGQLGSGAMLAVNKEGGEHIIGEATLEYAGRKLDYNDLGYSERSNLYAWTSKVEYRELRSHGPFLESHAYLAYWGATNISGLPLESGVELGVQGTFRNFWQYLVLVNYLPKRFDDREIGDGTALQRARLGSVDAFVTSNPSLPVSVELSGEYRWIRTGLEAYAQATLSVRPVAGLNLELTPALNLTRGEPRYATDRGEGQHIFARLKAQSLSAEARASYTFLPEVTLQVYAQFFLAAGHYTDFFTQSVPSGERANRVRLNQLRTYTEPLSDNPDFEQGALNVNAVLYWEYATGAALSLVYARSQDPDATPSPTGPGGLYWSAISRTPTADALMFKLSSFWGR